MTYLLFGCGLLLSGIAAYYAVMGLVAIFSTAVIPIAIMGATLEASKLVAASWLYRNWKTSPALLKTYFTIAVVVLMSLTSMGIFGYLSKAHLDQAVPTGDVVAKLNIIDEKIKTQKENIDAARKAINQLDAQVDQTLSRSSDEKGAANAVTIRQRQAKERNALFNEISKSQTEITKLNEERAPIASEVRKVEAEVGPIKYIAALIYGDSIDDTLLEKSVRIVILMIVLVFDPLAVLMLIAANREVLLSKPKHITSEKPLDVLKDSGITNFFDITRKNKSKEEDTEVNAWFDKVKQYARSLDEEVSDENNKRWNNIVSSLMSSDLKPGDLNYDPYTGITELYQPTTEKKENWDPTILQGPPATEPPEDFKKVVKEYFSEKKSENEQMLFVNEEPESKFILNPDFNPKDPFEEKTKGSVRPNSRRHPEE
jgi:hypothetical protein